MSVADWFNGKSAAELDAIEFQGRRLYADAIRRKDARTGEVRERKVRLRVPSAADKAVAAIDAIQWVRRMATERRVKVPDLLTKEQAEGLVGAARFDDLDTLCILTRSIFEHDAPHDPLYLDAAQLERDHDPSSLEELWQKLDELRKLEDPRELGELDEQKFWAVVATIAMRRNCSPLAVIDGSTLDSFIISMAVRLQSYRMPRSGSPSTET